MRRSDPLPERLDAEYLAELAAIAAPFGISRIGVASADVLTRARRELHRRKAAGLHDGMQFTYKNPDRSTDPGQAVRGARAVLVGARSYLLDDAPHEPLAADAVPARVARYAQADHYTPLRAGLWAVAHRLRRDGWKAVAFADDNSMVDREVAWRAGLGWFGKNANVLLDGVGSWFVLGSVVTTAPLPEATAEVPDGCGACKRCIERCPTGAIVADGVIDAARCLAWVLQKPGVVERHWRRAIGDRIYGCDECQEACPPTIRWGRREPARVDGDQVVEPAIDAVALLDADDDAVLARWGRWYVADRQPRWLRRNALMVIGNSGRGADARVQSVLARYLAHDDVVLRVHAVWAAAELGLHGLLPADDPDPDVQAELRHHR